MLDHILAVFGAAFLILLTIAIVGTWVDYFHYIAKQARKDADA